MFILNTIADFKQMIGKEPYYGSPILPYSQVEDFQYLSSYFDSKRVANVGPASTFANKNVVTVYN